MTIRYEGIVTSTSDCAAEAIGAGAAEGVAFRADRQTQGRGRHGRCWHSPEGNLYLSVILRPKRSMAEWPSLSLMAGLALYEAISQFRGNERLRLKWPNDVLLDGRKCAGLLLEVVEGAVILGCGVNCVEVGEIESLGEPAVWPAGSINHNEGDTPTVTADMLFEAFEPQLLARYNAWQGGGFEPLREAWLAAAAHLGQEITLNLGEGGIVTGVFQGLDTTGALLLRLDTGAVKTIQAGNVLKAHSDEGDSDASGD